MPHIQKVPSVSVLGREDEERVTVISEQMRHHPALLIERKPVRSQTAIDDLKILVSSICRDQNRSAGERAGSGVSPLVSSQWRVNLVEMEFSQEQAAKMLVTIKWTPRRITHPLKQGLDLLLAFDAIQFVASQ